LIVLLNRILDEWERFQAQLRKGLLKKFIDFDANGDGVLTLEEFKELMKSLEGNNISQDRVIILFNEALEMTSTEKDEDDKDRVGSSGKLLVQGGQSSKAGSDKMSPQCFVEAVIRNRLGGYGSEFLNFDFIANYEK
jgi:hypothetical protein